MVSKPTIYLAGPVASIEDGGASWRDRLQQEFADEYNFRDPLSKYNIPAEDLTVVPGESGNGVDTVGVDEIVEGDKELLSECDAVLVGYSRVHSIGTPMEVMWAYERNYPVSIWVRDGTDFEDLSPWYRYHLSAFTNDAKMALGHLKRQLEGPVDAE